MTTFKILFITLILLALTYTVVTFAANRKVERQKYQLIKDINGIEIRFYPQAVMATVSTTGSSYMAGNNNHFRTLAGYIFGGNKSSQKIAMTAPVHMLTDSGQSKMSFVMPSSYDKAALPTPNDSSVQLHYSQSGYFAAIKFGGYANEQIINRKIEELRTAILALGYQPLSTFSYLGYNAPWDVLNRENEIIVRIDYSNS